MPQSLSLVILHIVFSTKDRAPVLSEPIRSRLHAYLATVARTSDSDCYRVGGTADHVHLAVRMARTTTIAKLVEELKTSSSKWLKTQAVRGFAWQRGYGAFSVSASGLENLRRYIDAQEEHHRKQTFEEEFKLLLKKSGVEYDERYLLD